MASKYLKLWEEVDKLFKQKNTKTLELGFNKIKICLGFDIDHSFLNYKKELEPFGYKVQRIKLKEKSMIFEKLD